MSSTSKTYIKNPLTVIGVFAAIAEVSGAYVLVKLPLEIQAIFVWFVMLFPAGLVFAFFFTLFRKHHVLYAPSDFKDENAFMSIVSSSKTPTKDLLELMRSTERSITQNADNNMRKEDLSPPGGENTVERPESTLDSASQVDNDEPGEKMNQDDIQSFARRRLFTGLALDEIAERENIEIHRDVRVEQKDESDIPFDGLARRGSNDISLFEVHLCSAEKMRSGDPILSSSTLSKLNRVVTRPLGTSGLMPKLVLTIVCAWQAPDFKIWEQKVKEKIRNELAAKPMLSNATEIYVMFESELAF